jgi:ATP-dependent helicase/nuclease subunit A
MGVIAFPSATREDTIPDAGERTSALDTTASWITEAPAGSGKTGLLIQRYLKLLASVDDPSEVLALTFTQKATAEMRDRVLSALRGCTVPPEKPESDFNQLTRQLAIAALQRDEKLGWKLLDRAQRLNIRTIDSLCSEIAHAVPLQSEAAGFARPVADTEPLYRRAAHAVMMRFGGEDEALNSAVRTVLEHRDGDLPYCEKVLAEMLGTREQWGRLIPLTAEELEESFLDAVVLPRLNETLGRVLCAELAELHRCFDEDVLERLAEIARTLATADGYKGEPSRFAPCVSLRGPLEPVAEHRDYWILMAHLLLTGEGKWRNGFAVNHLQVDVSKQIKAQLKELIESISSDELAVVLHAIRNLPPATYPAGQWVLAKAFFRLLKLALVELNILFARDEMCDFSAVSLAARSALLNDGEEVRAALGWNLRHLLVDEMQDTSSSQYELLMALTAGWDGASQTVFLVGDPKQSIYLFRQARVELFQQAMRECRLGHVPLGVLQLSANFRSGRTLVQQFNDTFQAVFPSGGVSPETVTYSPSFAVNPPAPQEGIAWQIEMLPRQEDPQDSLKQRRRAVLREAQRIAATIADWRAKYGTDRRIAVLTRTRSHVTEIAKYLVKAGVPYRAVEIEALDEKREVLDVLAITRALLHPADRTAWLAVLRAPWCGAGLADLFRLAEGDQSSSRRQALPAHLRDRAATLAMPMRDRVIRTLDVMEAAVHNSGAQSLADRVERTWLSLGGDACTDALGRENVRLLLRLLDAMEAEGEAINEATLKRRAERLYAEPSHAPDAIDVMTIHKAKGLEWDLVLVPGMHRSSASDRYPFLDWLELPGTAEDGSRDVLLAPLPPKGDEAGLLNVFIRKQRKQRTNAELKRVFYVAATRARTALCLYAWPELSKDNNPARINQTLLEAAWSAAQNEIKLASREITLPLEIATDDEAEPLALAAAADPDVPLEAVRKVPRVERLPLSYDPLLALRERALPADSATRAPARELFERPQGSFGARVVGSCIHAFIERVGNEFAARLGSASASAEVAEALLHEVPSWQSAIVATLRSGGLPVNVVERAAGTVERALRNLLGSAEGRWLLLPHRSALSEAAWRSQPGAGGVRLDRSFFAGSAPGKSGEDTLWIVDFKTGDRDKGDLDAFMRSEREKYSGQLIAYAEIRLRALPPETPVMLALYYPLMDRLECWSYRSPSVAPPELAPESSRREQMSLFV